MVYGLQGRGSVRLLSDGGGAGFAVEDDFVDGTELRYIAVEF